MTLATTSPWMMVAMVARTLAGAPTLLVSPLVAVVGEVLMVILLLSLRLAVVGVLAVILVLVNLAAGKRPSPSFKSQDT